MKTKLNPSDMNDEQLRIAVAEALGWTYAKPAYSRVLNVHAVVGLDPDGERRTTPNWPADLNACHQFEKTLSRDQQQEYVRQLIKLFKEPLPLMDFNFAMLNATARQRCEALLAVLKPE